MEELDKVLGENLRKSKESCGISDKAILAVKEIDKVKKQPINDSTTLFTHKTIEAAIRSQRLQSQQRMNQVAQTKFGNGGQQEQGEGR